MTPEKAQGPEDARFQDGDRVEAIGSLGGRSPSPPPNPEEERALVKGLKAGREESLAGLMRLHWGGLLRFAVRMLEDRDRAEDVVQEAFVRLWRRRKTWERSDSVRPVLYRIVRNQALNEQRRVRNFRDWAKRFPPSKRDPSPSPLQAAVAEDLRGLVREAVDALPERRREIFLLVRFHQMSYKEVGAALDISPQTVANQMTQAMKDLREVLEPHLPARSDEDLRFRRA